MTHGHTFVPLDYTLLNSSKSAINGMNEYIDKRSHGYKRRQEALLQPLRSSCVIEVFFKCSKSLLRLQKEFQGRSYDLLTSHTAIVFCQYILLAWQHRKSSNERYFGGLFYLLCDVVGTLDWVVALQQLLDLINQVAQKTLKKIPALASYIKACLPISCCKS